MEIIRQIKKRWRRSKKTTITKTAEGIAMVLVGPTFLFGAMVVWGIFSNKEIPFPTLITFTVLGHLLVGALFVESAERSVHSCERWFAEKKKPSP